MASSIKISADNWAKLKYRLKEEYAQPSLFLIRYVMIRELGFSFRLHQEWRNKHNLVEVCYLDFHDDHLETIFRLKYSEYLNG
jgi:hypothetical protein